MAPAQVQSLVMATTQFNVRVTVETLERLREAAERFGVSSGNLVASEVLETYLDFWIAAKEGQQAVIEEQRAAVFGGKDDTFKSAKKGTGRKK